MCTEFLILRVVYRCELVMMLLLVCLSWSSGANAESGRPPMVLDTQTGVHDERRGVVLQSAPPDPAPIAAPAEIPRPAEQQRNEVPIVVVPYIQVPASNYRR